jgi:hypothetical protein
LCDVLAAEGYWEFIGTPAKEPATSSQHAEARWRSEEEEEEAAAAGGGPFPLLWRGRAGNPHLLL